MRNNELSEHELQQDQDEVDHLVLLYLRWLDSVTPGRSNLTPEGKLKIAQEAQLTGIQPTAKKHQLRPIVVQRAIRDFEAAVIHHHNLPITSSPIHGVTERAMILGDLEQEMRQWVRILNNESFARIIKTVPHVKALLEHYVRYRSLDAILKPLEVQFTVYQERSVRNYLRVQDPAESLDGLEPLARRYALATWLKQQRSFSKLNPDQAILEAAVFILELDEAELPESVKARVRSIRFFLKQVIQAERVAQNPRYQRRKNLYLSRQEMVGYYQSFQQQGIVPATLRTYGLEVVDEVPKSQRLPFILDRHQADAADWAGQHFLENILTWPAPKGKPLTVDVFLQNTSAILKQAKAVQAIPPKKP